MILLALSDVAREVDHAFKIIGWICLLLLVGIVIFTHLPQTPEAIANHYFSVYL